MVDHEQLSLFVPQDKDGNRPLLSFRLDDDGELELLELAHWPTGSSIFATGDSCKDLANTLLEVLT